MSNQNIGSREIDQRQLESSLEFRRRWRNSTESLGSPVVVAKVVQLSPSVVEYFAVAYTAYSPWVDEPARGCAKAWTFGISSGKSSKDWVFVAKVNTGWLAGVSCLIDFAIVRWLHEVVRFLIWRWLARSWSVSSYSTEFGRLLCVDSVDWSEFPDSVWKFLVSSIGDICKEAERKKWMIDRMIAAR